MCLIALSCLLACGGKDDEAPKQDTPAPATDQESDPGAPGRGLAATFQDALSGKRKVKSLKLIPKGAVVLAGANVQELVSRPIWDKLQASLGGRQRDQMEAATKCGVGPDKWRRFVIGASGNGNDMAMVVEAEGLGTRPVLDCLVAAIGNFELSEDGKRLSDSTGGGIVLGDDAIAFANPGWMPLVEKRIEGGGEAAIDELASVMARTDQTKTLWFAGVDFEELDEVSVALDSEVEDFAGWVDLSAGMSLWLSLSVPDAAKVRTDTETKWKGIAGMLREMVPAPVVDSVKFSDEGKLFRVEVQASESDLSKLASDFAKTF